MVKPRLMKTMLEKNDKIIIDQKINLFTYDINQLNQIIDINTSLDQTITFNINHNENLQINLLSQTNVSINLMLNNHNINQTITFNLAKNSHLNLTIINLSTCQNITINNNLNETNAKIDLRSMTILNNKVNQDLKINIYHLASLTFGDMYNLGIVNDEANLSLMGLNEIHFDMAKSESFQKLQGIILSENASITVDPILIIDNFDVKAGHAATVGRLSEEEIFYITSRGISIKEAKKMIVMGKIYLLLDSLDENVREKTINQILERL